MYPEKTRPDKKIYLFGVQIPRPQRNTVKIFPQRDTVITFSLYPEKAPYKYFRNTTPYEKTTDKSPYTPIPRIFSGYGYYPVVSFLLPKSLKSFRNPLREKSRSTPYLFGILPRCIFSFTERSPGNPLRDFSVKEKIQQGSIPKRYGV